MNAFDITIFQSLHSLTESLSIFNWLFIFIARYLPYILGIILIILVLKEKDIKRKIIIGSTAILSAIISRGIIVEAIRFFYQRLRPFEALQLDPLFNKFDPSFPSGHMAFFFALVPAVFMISKKWGWIFTISAILIGLARIISGVHWPSDILAGAVIGLLSGFGVKYLLKSKNSAL